MSEITDKSKAEIEMLFCPNIKYQIYCNLFNSSLELRFHYSPKYIIKKKAHKWPTHMQINNSSLFLASLLQTIR